MIENERKLLIYTSFYWMAESLPKFIADYSAECRPPNNATDALSRDKSNLNMNMHDGHAKCTQLMVSLFRDKGLMYIQNSNLLQ